MVKILIVDDDGDARRSIREMLAGEGYEVMTAGSGREAVDKMKGLGPHIVLLDIYMPQMDGFETLEQIRDIDKQAIVMMMTASADIDIARRAIKAGAVNYLIKPVDSSLLKNSLRSWAIQIEARQFWDTDILALEYDAKKVKTMEDVFAKKGYTVRKVETASEASRVADMAFDLLIVRADLLGDSAVAAVANYKKTYPEFPVVVTTPDSRAADYLIERTALYGNSRRLPYYFDTLGFILVVQHMIVESRYKRKMKGNDAPGDFIFVVDDEPETCAYIEDYLVAHGYRIWATSDSGTVLDQVKKMKPGIVLLDIVLPGVNGIELLKGIRKTSPMTQVIMITGVKNDAICRECMEAGAADYLVKPFSLEQLKATILVVTVKAHLPK